MDEDTQYKKNESAKTKVNKPIICADGFRMSVQAHSLANCKKDPATGRYTHVEVGYPTEAEQLLEEWAEEPENLCKTIGMCQTRWHNFRRITRGRCIP